VSPVSMLLCGVKTGGKPGENRVGKPGEIHGKTGGKPGEVKPPTPLRLFRALLVGATARHANGAEPRVFTIVSAAHAYRTGRLM
jgi:hypothetical protein